jgi:DNA-binding MarR family transcriptional regulator
MNDDDPFLAITKVFSLKNAIFGSFDSRGLEPSINKTQERVLMMTWRHEGATMQFLSREAGLEKGSLTSVVDSLETLGLAVRIRQEDDRRSFVVQPTQEGRDLARQIDVLFQAHLDALFDKLGPEERERFTDAICTLARDIPRLCD